ncbi:P-II family nitrogen regulator [Sulfuriferula nivalis]|uniref:Nitrogen fixation nifHD region glnB 2 n=1 Tax=Sulfuriferula nivalis TaxID=2675298 RepID=A0A809RYV5_9PROT|nr:P-II family nitrogen regulator [Sulfuriferula nivalis]BBO99377.1 nitrogen fixation nifHD region glnB 2 [Sulfuriferula nivalis]
MKEIRAVIRPKRLSQLREALRDISHFPGVTVFRGEGFTAPESADRSSLRAELTDFTDKVLVSVIARDEMVDVITKVIMDECRTSQIGDGLIWVMPIVSVQRIRDGHWLQASENGIECLSPQSDTV